MIVIGPANDILEETYIVSTESRGYIQEPSEEQFTTLPSPPFHPLPPTSSTATGARPDLPNALPDLIPAGWGRDSRSPRPILFAQPSNPHEGRQTVLVEMGPTGLQIRDLVHPALSEPLRNQQMTTFKLVKLVSDFNHQLSKLHEQFAEDTAHLVETFRKKTADILNDGPRCSNSVAEVWDHWLADVMQDSAAHSEVSNVVGRAVARPLLEKTFHMKIQSRKVFSLRQNFETLLAENEDKLSMCHNEYRNAWSRHVEVQNPTSLAFYLERHNNYVQQIHSTNAMIDQYYMESLPMLLQELDDVYSDVTGVVMDSLTEGTIAIANKFNSMGSRWANTTEIARKINAPQDLTAFVNSLSIPDYVPVTRHSFVPPPAKETTNGRPTVRFEEIGLPIKTCEVVLDRVVSEAARVRYEEIRGEAKDVEGNCKMLSDALDTLIRIQAKNLDQQLFNKANEMQEEISRKRFDLRVAQIKLAGLRAQKELFSSKAANEAEPKGLVEGVPPGGPRERKLSTSSSGSIKSKWVKAFKTIKGKGEPDKPRNGAAGGGNNNQIVENSHIFQEYTYKKITPCDVCSQILRGHTRQGLKCKLCRMNVHPDCQEKVVKCQPKSKLLRRQRSASDMDPRPATEGEDETGRLHRSLSRSSREPSVRSSSLQPPSGAGLPPPPPGCQRVRPPGQPVPLAANKPLNGANAQEGLLNVDDGNGELSGVSPGRRRMGGSYSSYATRPHPAPVLSLPEGGELVDTSGRRIRPPSELANLLAAPPTSASGPHTAPV